MASHSLPEDRTSDVTLDKSYTFENMLLPEPILKALTEAGYIYPSMIQKKGIPIGRCGYSEFISATYTTTQITLSRSLSLPDLLVQSKSGTGKTLVFSLIALEKFYTHSTETGPQTLILCPTREIAVQTADTLKCLGKYLPHFKAAAFIGGQSLADDRQNLQGCSIVVGSPGRILHLIELSVFNTKNINLLILDEIDLLTELNFNLNKIIACLDQKRLQVITVSATLDAATEQQVSGFMSNPIGITAAKEVPVLRGIGQFVCRLPADEPGVEMLRKFAQLKEILSTVTFKQCFVFTNSQSLAESYKQLLAKESWPSEVITGAYEQSQRLVVLRKLKEFKIRVLLSTDLMARGIDAENVDLVVNMDVPRNGMVYLHRIGRAGRFGTRGLAVTLVATEEQEKQFEGIQEQFGMQKLVRQWPMERGEVNKVWEMVEGDDGEVEVIKERRTMGKSVTFEEKEEEDGEEDALALFLDSSSLAGGNSVEKKKKKEQKVEAERCLNIFEEFEKFSLASGNLVEGDEEEVKGAVGNESEGEEVFEENVIESVSLVNNVDSQEEFEEDILLEVAGASCDKKKRKGKKVNCDTVKMDKWQTMFKTQCAMILDYVERNREGRRGFGGKV